MRSRAWVYLGGALILAAVATGAFVLSQRDGGQQDVAVFGDKLLSDSRSRLSICVDVVGGAKLSTEQLEAVEDALADGLARAPSVPAEYDRPEVVAGCPLPAAELGTDVWDPWVQSIVVTRPSKHRLFMYFVPDALYAVTFDAEPYAKGVEEFVCSGDQCSPATLGVYLPLTASSAVMEDAILAGLHLLPTTPIPDPDYDWEVCEFGQEPTNPAYTCDDYWEDKDDRERDVEQQGMRDSGSRLFTTNRTRLSVCVDGAAGYRTSARELEAVRSALQRGLDAAPDAPTELRELLVSTGCPAPPAALTDSTIEPANRFIYVGRGVETLSGHRLFVYFMPPDVYTASFGGEPFTRAWAEVLCTGDACAVMTSSVYAPESIAQVTLQRALMENLGVIRPPTPVPCDPEGPGQPTCDVLEDDIGDIAR